MLTNNILKPTSFLLVLVMIANLFMFAVLLSPINSKTAHAQQVVYDPKQGVWNAYKKVWDQKESALTKIYRTVDVSFQAWEKSESILAKVSYTLMYITVNIIIAKMTQDIITWIDGGAHGSPKIMQDPNKELRQALDIAGAEVTGALLGLDSGQLCNPSFLKVDLFLEIDKWNQPTVFQNDLKCSFQGGRKAWQAFKEDFSKGGWKSWIQLGSGANNDFGNVLETQKELARLGSLRANAVKTEIDIGKGFKATEVCRVTQNIDLNLYAKIAAADFSSQSKEYFGEDVVAYAQEHPDLTDTEWELWAAAKNEELAADNQARLESSVEQAARINQRASTGTAFTLGIELKELMTQFGFHQSQMEEFKKMWVENGGKFECKNQTPAQVAADMFSKAVMGPFETVNKIAADSLANIGKAAPQILQPYLAAISTSALNLLVKGEKKWLSERVLGLTPVRKFPRQNSDNFKDANATLDASKNVLASTLSLREMLMQTALEFTLFTGTLRKISEKKSLLWDWPIVPEDLNDTGLIWNYITVWMKGGKVTEDSFMHALLPARTSTVDPVTSATSSDQFIADETERVVTTETKANMPNGFPTLPPAGVMSIVANACGAPTQEILPSFGAAQATNLSLAMGFIIDSNLTPIKNESLDLNLASINSVSNRGWSNGVRITAFDDNGDAIADRFVREKTTDDKILTFIDAGLGENEIRPDCVGSCSHKANYDNSSPPDGTLDVYNPTMDPNIYYSELAIFDVANERLRTDPYGSSAQRVYYHPGEANQILGGSIFVIEKTEPLNIDISQPAPAKACVDHRSVLKYTLSGNVGTIHAGGSNNTLDGLGWGTNCPNGIDYTNPVAEIYWDKSTDLDSVTVTVDYMGELCNWTEEAGMACEQVVVSTLNATVNKSTASGILAVGDGIAKDDGSVDLSITSSITWADNRDVNKVGIPAYTEDSKYLKKFFSPAYPGASSEIQNSRRTVIYDDPVNKTMTMLRKRNSDAREEYNNLPYVEHDNPNPYKMQMSSFYDEMRETMDEFMVKIRVLLGYTGTSEEKTHLSGLADQIGAIPDDDPTSTSTSDVLTKYNDLADLYQNLFTGFSSETSLEGIDPEYKILSPTEINIKLALIGKRCPTVPPTADSSQTLRGGCPEFESQYNMAKRFMFEQDDPTGFATNPFTGINSRVLAGILNLDEMTQQLATLPPDKNIIKLIRLRQILEQLQVYPKEIKIEGKGTNADIIPPKLQGVDVVQLSLRNYPEIEAYLNDTTTQNKKIGELITAYGFTDSTNTKEAYPVISNDLENILPDIVTQISDKLKEVFLKRTELELANAKTAAQERLLDFIYFANDLNPAIQLQVPADLSFGLNGTEMQLDESNSKIIRVVASELSNDKIPDQNNNKDLQDFKGKVIYKLSENILSGLGPCMSVSGENMNCANASALKLRGFKTTSWGTLQSKITVDGTKTTEDNNQGVLMRQSLMAAIRKKIKMFSVMIGTDITSADFKRKIDSYILPSTTDSDGRQKIDIAQWDWAIQKGLEDVNVLFTAVYSNNLPNEYANRPSNALYFDNSRPIPTDVQTKMELLKNNFSLIQSEVEKIIEKFSSGGSADLMSIKPDMEDLNKLLTTMEVNFNAAEACAAQRVRSGSTSYASSFSYAGGVIAGFTGIGAIFGSIGGAVLGGIADSLFGAAAKKRAKKKAKKAAAPCNTGATEYNKALLQLMNKFVCGQTWSEPQQ